MPLYFETENLLTRPFKIEDLEPLKKIVTNPHFYYSYFNTDKSAENFIKNALNAQENKSQTPYIYRAAICKKDTSTLIGSFALFDACKNYMNIIDKHVYEMGLFLDYKYQNKGYGREITPHRVKACFELFHNCVEIHTTVHPKNTASIAIQQKMGFKKITEGNLFPKTNDQINDRLVFKLLKKDWNSSL